MACRANCEKKDSNPYASHFPVRRWTTRVSESDYYYNTHTMASALSATLPKLPPSLHLRQPYVSSPALLPHSPFFCSVRPITLSSSLIIGERLQCRSKASSSSAAEMASEKSQGKNVKVFDSEEDLAVALAKYTADLSDKFTKERGSFTVVVSGGSLIKSLRSPLLITNLLNLILFTFH